MMRNNVQRLGEHVTTALLGRLTPWTHRWRSWLAPAVRLVTRRRPHRGGSRRNEHALRDLPVMSAPRRPPPTPPRRRSSLTESQARPGPSACWSAPASGAIPPADDA